MYQVERHGSDYAVYNDAGTVATCGNADDASRIARALNRDAVIGEVREALEGLRKEGHFENEEDPWYSCPKHEGYSGLASAEYCYCGIEKDNARIEQALAALDAADAQGGA